MFTVWTVNLLFETVNIDWKNRAVQNNRNYLLFETVNLLFIFTVWTVNLAFEKLTKTVNIDWNSKFTTKQLNL